MSYLDLLQALDLLIGIAIAACICGIGYVLGFDAGYVRYRTDAISESGQGTTAAPCGAHSTTPPKEQP